MNHTVLNLMSKEGVEIHSVFVIRYSVTDKADWPGTLWRIWQRSEEERTHYFLLKWLKWKYKHINNFKDSCPSVSKDKFLHSSTFPSVLIDYGGRYALAVLTEVISFSNLQNHSTIYVTAIVCSPKLLTTFLKFP